MPLHEYKEEIIEFSELYHMCTEFKTTPDKIKKWKAEQPYEFRCFRMFFAGMASQGKAMKMEMEQENE